MNQLSPTRYMSRVGMIVEDKYEVVRLLGAGGMGEVYEARHLQIARRVALKFLLPSITAEPALLERFRNEARAAGALQHENVAAVYDMSVAADGSPYFVMEFLEGSDCAAELELVGTFNRWRAANTIIQVCRGLATAHAHGIIHRDLKPANLFLCRRADGAELVKILDFGIAKLQRAPRADHSSGAIFGTPFYMSPERARGDRDVDHRADIYALGVILYELLSGQKPHDGASALQILHSILTREPTPLAELRRDIPAALCAVVHRAMARSPDERFASVAELGQALEPFAFAGPGASLDVTMPEAEPAPAAAEHDRLPSVSSLQRIERGSPITLSPSTATRSRKLVGLLVAAIAVIGFAAGLLRMFGGRERAKTPAPAAASVTQAIPGTAPVQPPVAIDRPDVRDDRPLPAAPETWHIEPAPAAKGFAVPARERNHGSAVGRSIVRRSPDATAAPASASNVVQHGLDGASTAPPAKVGSSGRLRIDHQSPYE